MLGKKAAALLQTVNENGSQLRLASFLMATTVLTSVTIFPALAQSAYPAPQSQTQAQPKSEQDGKNKAKAKDSAATSSATPTQQMPTVTVESTRAASDGYQVTEPSLYKLTSPLVDTPQSITSIPRQLLEDQGATTVRDALRNVPGISLAAGEGGAQGDNLTIRGFTARSDFFMDGMRDFGSYYRDPFDLESIEVLKGPASLLFGRGSTGGVVNQVTKQPELYSYNNASFAFGSDLTRRATVDMNKQIDETSAIRLNVMGNAGNVVDRDGAYNSRYGVAPSLALGIGTPTRLTFDYFHQSEDDIPDYGLPWYYSRPAPVDRQNFYGFQDKDHDYLRTDVDVATAKIEHDFNKSYTIRNQLRVANYQRDARITEPQIGAPPPATPLSAIGVTRRQIAVDSTETFVDNQTDLTSKFNTGTFKHVLITGIEGSHETSSPTRPNWTGTPSTSLTAPAESDAFTGTFGYSSNVHATADSLAGYATDTMSLNEQWDIIGGVRYDYVDSYYNQNIAPAAKFTRTDGLTSWRGGIVYKPVVNGSFYFATGTSFNPSVEQLALSTATANTPPEETMSYEVGTKWDLFNKRLSTNFAIFRDEKTNARTTDPNNPLLNVVSGDQRVDGFEIGANGHITEKWQMFTGYAFMDSKVVKSNNPLEQGNQLANAPKHTFNLFSTYDLPDKWQVGGGMNAVSARNASTTPNGTSHVMETAPGYVTFDAMAKYGLTEKVNIQLNVYNLLNKYYYDQIHPAHIVPGAGRTFLVTTNVSF